MPCPRHLHSLVLCLSRRAHRGTGAEIWRQLQGRLDAFVSGAGTGGTIAGVSRFLKVRCHAGLQIEG
jgi:cysteine synthase